MNAYYFGAWRQPGHGLFATDMHSLGLADSLTPWTTGEMDGPMCCPSNKYASTNEERQPQGVARLHHRGGWTALSFWDRTGDSRGNSNSSFLLEGTLDFDEALAEARERFPLLFDRFTFEIVPEPENSQQRPSE